MPNLSDFCWYYLMAMMLVALRFGWHMFYRLDHLDWHYGKVEVWAQYLTLVIVWPVLIFRWRLLINPAPCFQSPYGQAERQREETRLRTSPPPCGDLILYRPAPGYSEETVGEFIFLANDVLENLARRLKESPKLQNDHEGAIMNWVLQRDTSIDTPTPVPRAWQRFEFIANDLVRKGRAEVRCLTCNESVPAEALSATDEGGSWGWLHNRLYCPAGHMLLTVAMMHVCRPLNRTKTSGAGGSEPLDD